MDREALAARIDHTVLGPVTTPADVDRVVEEAVEYGMNVCIPPCYVADVRRDAPDDLTVVTVIGFPHGQHAPAAKASEARVAHADGADELDVVTNVGRLKAGELDAVRADLETVVDATPLPVKVIIETPL
ncbi:MAG: 2-deoxyribose-5-phosphate aldolase, partial [Halobacterium sp.]